MRKELITATLAIVFFTLLLGLAYPLAVTGIAQVAFPNAADGSKVKVDGRTVGSKLIGQEFKGRTWFHSRPSATGYAPDITFFNNLGPNNRELAGQFRGALARYLKTERPYDPGLTRDEVPVDAVTTSASGVDPHISQANARIQAHRVAKVRGLSLDRVDELIDDNTDGRFVVFGEPGVNVLELNIDIDRETPLDG
jgi:K+-transporting ATPase ATPase C chain